MKFKKAISPIISWVLLVGLTVAIGAMITNWAIQQTKRSFNPEQLAEGGIYCDGVSFSIDTICKKALTDSLGNSIGTAYLMSVTNRGSYSIKNISADLKDNNGVNTIKCALNGQICKLSNIITAPASSPLPFLEIVASNPTSLLLNPLISPENKEVACSEKKVLLTNNDYLDSSKIAQCCTSCSAGVLSPPGCTSVDIACS